MSAVAEMHEEEPLQEEEEEATGGGSTLISQLEVSSLPPCTRSIAKRNQLKRQHSLLHFHEQSVFGPQVPLPLFVSERRNMKLVHSFHIISWCRHRYQLWIAVSILRQ
jgi:hypothetical protein